MYSVLINKQNVIKEYVFKQNNQESEQGYDSKRLIAEFPIRKLVLTSVCPRGAWPIGLRHPLLDHFCNYDNLKTAVCVAYDTWS